MPPSKPRRRFPHKLYLVLLDNRDGPATLRSIALRDDDRSVGRRRKPAGSAKAILGDPVEIPVTRELSREGDIRLLRRLPIVATAQVGRALPVTAVLATIHMELAVHEGVRLRHMTSLPLAATV